MSQIQDRLATGHQPVVGHANLAVVNDPLSPVAEAFRSLRSTVKFARGLSPVRSVLIADAGTGGQHALTAANLAAALALAGDRTILVDANLRDPKLHEFFHLPNQEGLGEWLTAGEPGLMPPLVETGVAGLRLLTAGHLPSTAGAAPSDLLSEDRCAQLFEQLQGKAEFLVVDVAPLSEVGDALSLAPRIDGVLLLVRSGRTKRVRAQRAKESLDRVGAHVLGAVLTDSGGSLFRR